MANIAEKIRSRRKQYKAETSALRSHHARNLYNEVVEGLVTETSFSTNFIGVACSGIIARFETTDDLKFFKDFIEKQSDHHITCQTGFGIFSLLKCSLKD